MQWVMGFITMQWHAHRWHKTILDVEQSYELAMEHLRKDFDYYQQKGSWKNPWIGEIIEFIDLSARIARTKRLCSRGYWSRVFIFILILSNPFTSFMGYGTPATTRSRP